LKVSVKPVLGVEGELWDVESQSFQPTTIGTEFWFRGRTSSWELSEIESTAFVWQGHLWEDRIVGTFGLRKDDVKTFVQDGEPPLNNVGKPVFSEWSLSDVPENISAETETIGVVVKPFEWLNVHYNESENIVPVGGRIDMYGNTIAPQSGTGEDYGFSLNLLENKLTVKVNWFEVAQNNVTQDALTSVAFWRVTRFDFEDSGLRQDAIANGETWQDPPAGHPGRDPQLKAVTNFESEGMEIEAVYNPMPNWRILLNVAQQETIQSSMAPALRQFVQERIAFWETLEVWDSPDYGPNASQTWEINFQRLAGNPLEFEIVQEGTTTAQQREWRVNFVTDYQFTDAMLEGVNVGGAIRWQDSPIIGFREGPRTATGNPTLDAGSPIDGDSETTFDFWIGYSTTIWDGRIDWNIQLNIQDVFADDDFIPIRANPDGSTATYRIAQPTNYFITSSFKF